MNFANEIEKIAAGPILGIVIGRMGKPDEMSPFPPDELFDVLLTWEQARPWLDRKYYDGFGRAECWPILAWTADRCLFVREYDGSTTIHWMPRNPESVVAYWCGVDLDDDWLDEDED